jgi:putative ABC transport system permease protein
LSILEGAFFLPVDESGSRQVCVLGTTARQKLFGLNDPIGMEVKINNVWFVVLGVLADELTENQEFEGVRLENPNNDIYIPLQTLLTKFEHDPIANELDQIIIQLPPDAKVPEQAALISGMMGSMHRQIDDFSLIVPERLLQQSRQTQRIFNIVMGAIASISLLVGGIGIMNIMLASVLERTTEIGLRRALGARRRDISRQFVLEAVVISVSGAVMGILLGYAISNLVATYSGWPTVIRPVAIILGVGVSMTIGLIFGIYPARQAAQISPIEALRWE